MLSETILNTLMNIRNLVPAFLAFTLMPFVQAGWVDIVEYKEIEGGENLTLHIANPPGHTAEDKSPAVIFFFGGGWKQGKPGQFYPFIRDLSKQGIVGISAQYRTKSSHGATPTDCVIDGKSAVRYVREHADELGIDPDKIIVGGGSAGGHVAACTAIDIAPQDVGDNRDVSPRPVALVLFNPVLSVGPDGYAHGYVKQHIDDWRHISPLHNAGANFPPTLVMVGTEDNVLPLPMAQEFDQKLKDAGVRSELVTYEGASHGFFNKPEYREKTSEEMMKFLRELGYLQ